MKRDSALACAMVSRAYGRNRAHGVSLDRVVGRRRTQGEAARRVHLHSGKHETVSLADRFGDGSGSGSSRLPRVYAA